MYEKSLESVPFSELSLRYAFYVLLQSDLSKMRLLPEVVFSENDSIYRIPDVYILYMKSPIKVYRRFPIYILGTTVPVPLVPVYIAFFIHILVGFK